MAKGMKTGGRQRGTPNKTTLALKEAILAAGEAAGREQGNEGLVSYLTWMAKTHPPAFCTLLGKVLPLQVAGDPQSPIQVMIQGSDAGLL